MDKLNTIVFSEIENKELDKAREIRSQMIDVMTKEGIPSSPKDLRLLNEVLTAQEGSIHGRSNTRLKQKEITSNEANKDEILEILRRIKTTGEVPSPQASREERSIEVQLVKGQTTLVEDSDISGEFTDK